MGSHFRRFVLVALAALLLAPLTSSAASSKHKADSKQQEPPTRNPYANKPYAGCEGGYCPARNPEVEAALYKAAASGDAAELQRLLDHPELNSTRNIVPDKDGFVRVVDAAVWVAAKKGRLDSMKVLLDKGYDADYEEGHVVDLAAANGDTAMLQLLLDKGFAIGSEALAYAAKHHNADMMKALITAVKNKAKGREPDLKSAMQAACAAGNETVLRMLVEEGGFKEILHPISKRPGRHDWRGDYVAEAVATGHSVVLELLFSSGYTITWQNAQELVKLAAAVGKPESMFHLMSQPTIAEDEEETEEAVENGLKVAAEEGKGDIVDYFLRNYPAQSKAPCPGALVKATMYGHNEIARMLQRACNISASSSKLQAAGWLGALFNAARGGHADVAKLLMAHEEASALLTKLYANLKPRKDGPPRPPNPEKDPLAVAAARGYMGIVELLSPQRALCAPCAAVAAAGAGREEVFEHLVAGPAASLLEGDEGKVQDALRAAAAAMEGGHWGIVRTLMGMHQSDMLGPYFLPAIAQQGKVEDLGKMMELIELVGCHDAGYVASQLSSAMVSAALSGDEEMLLALQEARGRWEAGGTGAGEDAAGGDRTEL